MKKIKKLLCLAMAVAIVMSGLTGCSSANDKNDSSKTDGENSSKKDSLVYCLNAEPQSIDVLANSMVDYSVLYQVYDSLVRIEGEDNIVPALAEKWEISEDGKEVTFYLKKDVKFHNGDIMTAEDVAFSLNRSIASPLTSVVTSSMDSAEVIDANTVKLKLKTSFGPILYCVSSPNCSILNKKVVEKVGDSNYGREPVGTGAYKFVSWKAGDRIVLERFDDYYRGQAPIKNLTFRIITDSSTASVTLENGEIDFLERPAATDRKNLIENEKLAYYETEAASTYYLAINHESEIFSNKKVREALSYAIDKQAIVLGAFEGIGTPLETPMATNCFGYPENFKNNQYDPEKAKQLLAEAGYPNGFTTKLLAPETTTYYKPTEIIQEQLRVVGIIAEIEKVERGVWMDRQYKGQYEIGVSGLGAMYPDSDYIYSEYHSGLIGKTNYFFDTIPELDKQLDIGRNSMDEDERLKAYEEVCNIVKDEAVSIPLFALMNSTAVNKNLKGVKANSLNRFYVFDFSW